MEFLSLLAQATAETEQPGGIPPFFLMLAVVFLAFYFLILRPQKKEQQNRQQKIESIKKGTKVITAGGIHGTVVDSSKADTLAIEVAKGVKMVFNRSSISIINDDEKSDKKDDAKSNDNNANDKSPKKK